MKIYLCSDATGRHLWIRGQCDKIEAAGFEIAEEQSEEFEGIPDDKLGEYLVFDLGAVVRDTDAVPLES